MRLGIAERKALVMNLVLPHMDLQLTSARELPTTIRSGADAAYAPAPKKRTDSQKKKR